MLWDCRRPTGWLQSRHIDTRCHVGHHDYIKAFADTEAAQRRFKAHDPEGVAFGEGIAVRAGGEHQT